MFLEVKKHFGVQLCVCLKPVNRMKRELVALYK